MTVQTQPMTTCRNPAEVITMKHHRTNRSTWKWVPTIPMFIFSLMILPTAQAQSGFSGSLQSVSITDAQKSNTPPTAAFNHLIDNNIVQLDAGTSSDIDGSITSYKWKFSDGTVADGVTISHPMPPAPAALTVTLTVTDNSQGISITQKTVQAIPEGIADEYDTDVTSNYVKVMGSSSLEVTNSYLHILKASSQRHIAYHSKSLDTANQSIEYTADLINAANNAGAVFRYNPSTKSCYVAYFDSSRLLIRAFDGTNWVGTTRFSTTTFAAGKHNVKIVMNGNSITAEVNGTPQISVVDTTYSQGNYAGVYFYRWDADPKIYNFVAKALK